jgi:hypothetical protein
LGQYFGDVSGAAVTMRYNVIVAQMQKDKKLKGRIKRLEKQILKN